MQERGKEREDGKDVDLGDEEEFGGMHVEPVAKFVSEDGFDVIGFTFFDEGVENNDVLALWGV